VRETMYPEAPTASLVAMSSLNREGSAPGLIFKAVPGEWPPPIHKGAFASGRRVMTLPETAVVVSGKVVVGTRVGSAVVESSGGAEEVDDVVVSASIEAENKRSRVVAPANTGNSRPPIMRLGAALRLDRSTCVRARACVCV
jgi:hypothetical protein